MIKAMVPWLYDQAPKDPRSMNVSADVINKPEKHYLISAE
jgi:hypothetical protein